MSSFIANALRNLLIVGLLTAELFAQGGSFVRQVVSGTVANGGTGAPIPYANVLVCSTPATGTPCSPVASIYADQALTQPLSNPFAADINGLYSIFTPTGEFLVQESAPVGAGYSFSESFLIFSNGTGTVSSVGLSVPSSLFTVTGINPITTSGVLSFGLNAQNSNQVFGTCTGGLAPQLVPAFCAINANMLPSTLNATTFSGTITTSSGITDPSFLTVSGASTLNTVTASGASIFNGTATFNNPITGAVTFSGAVTTSAGINDTGGLIVDGTTFLGNLYVSGNSSFAAVAESNTSVVGTLGVTGAITTSSGYQIGGSYGTSGYALVSTGTGTAFASIGNNYQTVALNGAAQTQRPVLNFSSAFTVTDSASPAETTIGLSGSTGIGEYVQSATVTSCGSTCAFSYPHVYSAIHSCVCSGEGGSCNVASKTTSTCTINATVGTNDIVVSGVY